MKAAAKGASGQSGQGHGKGRPADNHDADVILAKLYVTHRNSLEEYLRRFVNEHDAQDIVHEVFLTIWLKQPAWIAAPDVRRLLFVSCRNRARDLLRSLSRCEYRDPLDLDSMQVKHATTGTGAGENLDPLYVCLDRCHESNLRRVLAMRLAGKRLSEIADGLGISMATVKRRLIRIRRIADIFEK